MKKTVAVIIILLISASIIFYIGYIPFHIPNGQYGIITTKTGGTAYPVVKPGAFYWTWERLLPTNLQLHTFPLTPTRISVITSSELPSGNLYARTLNLLTSFNYSLTAVISATAEVDELPQLIARSAANNQDSLDSYMHERISELFSEAIQKCLADIAELPDNQVVTEQYVSNLLTQKFQQTVIAEHITILRCSVLFSLFPDFRLYKRAKENYTTYLQTNAYLLAELSARTSASQMSQQRLKKLDTLLSKYPNLAEMLSLQETDQQILKELQSNTE